MAPKAKKKLKRQKKSKGSTPPRRGRDPLAQLAGLSEAEKRKRLLELLCEDVCGESDSDISLDEGWKMPELGVDGRTADAGEAMSFDFRMCDVGLGEVEVFDQLRRSCRLVHPLDGSSWLPCGAEPRCLAERVAAEIFAYHTRGAVFDPARSGAEWWAQVRQGGHREERIQFHWDTDECAVERHGVNIHPHLSTVTYLTDSGAPTMVVECRNPRQPGSISSIYGPIQRGLLSHPRIGKHIVFDGQLLHGTVPQPAEKGERVTFLVNVWLNHKPSNCRPLPEEMAAHLGILGHTAAAVEFMGSQLPKTIKCESAQNFLETHFARQELYFSKVVAPLPLVLDTAVVEWSQGAELCGIDKPATFVPVRTKASSREAEGSYPLSASCS